MSIIVFDIDGVIADTEDLVKRAYFSVGVLVPKGMFGSSWTAWLVDLMGGDLAKAERIHSAKVRVYSQMAKDVKPLPPAAVAKKFASVYYITAAAKKSSNVILRTLGLNSNRLLDAECDTQKKADWLDLLARSSDRSVVYIDDNLELGNKIAECTMDSVVVIHYHGQTEDELMKEIMAWM